MSAKNTPLSQPQQTSFYCGNAWYCDVFFAAAADLVLANGRKLVCAPLSCCEFAANSAAGQSPRPTLRAPRGRYMQFVVVRFSIVVARNKTTKRYKTTASFYFRKFFFSFSFCCNFAFFFFFFSYTLTRNNKIRKLHLAVTQRFCCTHRYTENYMHFKYPTIFCSKISKTQTPFFSSTYYFTTFPRLNSRKQNHLGASRLWSYLAAAAPLHAMSRGKHTCAAGDMVNFVLGPTQPAASWIFRVVDDVWTQSWVLRTKCKVVLFRTFLRPKHLQINNRYFSSLTNGAPTSHFKNHLPEIWVLASSSTTSLKYSNTRNRTCSLPSCCILLSRAAHTQSNDKQTCTGFNPFSWLLSSCFFSLLLVFFCLISFALNRPFTLEHFSVVFLYFKLISQFYLIKFRFFRKPSNRNLGMSTLL